MINIELVSSELGDYKICNLSIFESNQIDSLFS